MDCFILGTSPAWANPYGASSGYLVDRQLLIDCGNGVVGKLRQYSDASKVKAVVISHRHGDHIADLLPLAYLFKYGLQQPAPQLWVPADDDTINERFDVVTDVLPQWLTMFARAQGANPDIFLSFDLRVYHPGQTLQVAGGYTITTALVPHLVPTAAMDIVDEAGDRWTYSADCGPNDVLPVLAANTPLLLCEANMPANMPLPIHLTAEEAGTIAAQAAPQQLLLTHYAVEIQDTLVQRAQTTFSGNVEAASIGQEWRILGDTVQLLP